MARKRARGSHESELAESILDLYGDFSSALIMGQRDAWLFVDLTMPQIKALFLVVTWGRATGSRLAQGLGVGLPSVTRFVDRLVDRGLVVREDDPSDRRVTDVLPTDAGRRVVENFLSYRRDYLRAALGGLDVGQLREVERGL